MTSNSFSLRRATLEDLPAIATIHRQAYSTGHFTSHLAVSVLIDYYRHFLADGAEAWLAIAPQASSRDEIVGFAVFGRGIQGKIAHFMRTNTIAIVGTSLRNPLAAGKKAVRRLWLKSSSRRPMVAADFLLLSIAVAQPGRGVGGQLLDFFLVRAADEGASMVGLYVNCDNVDAINAYVRRGFLMRELYGGQFYMECNI